MEEKNKKTETGAHRSGMKKGIIVLIVIAALLAVGMLLYGSRKQDSEQVSLPQVSQAPDDAARECLVPELLRDEILSPALSYHPGTAGSSLSSASAAAAILRFATDSRMHLEDQAAVNRLMADASALLTGEEQTQLRETLPGLLAFTDETLEVYPDNRGIFDDAGCVDTVDAAIKADDVKEDWSRIRTALDAAFLQN